jgi:hypothetical protein
MASEQRHKLDWRIKTVLAAWLIAAVAGALLFRNLMLGEWKDLHIVSGLLVPFILLLSSGSYFLIREARRNSK